jgi:hypothetical protein
MAMVAALLVGLEDAGHAIDALAAEALAESCFDGP